MVQGLRLCAPNAEDLGLILGRGTRSFMPQLRGIIGIANYIYVTKRGKSIAKPVTIKLSPVAEKKSLIFYYGRKVTFIEDTSIDSFHIGIRGLHIGFLMRKKHSILLQSKTSN